MRVDHRPGRPRGGLREGAALVFALDGLGLGLGFVFGGLGPGRPLPHGRALAVAQRPGEAGADGDRGRGGYREAEPPRVEPQAAQRRDRRQIARPHRTGQRRPAEVAALRRGRRADREPDQQPSARHEARGDRRAAQPVRQRPAQPQGRRFEARVAPVQAPGEAQHDDVPERRGDRDGDAEHDRGLPVGRGPHGCGQHEGPARQYGQQGVTDHRDQGDGDDQPGVEQQVRTQLGQHDAHNTEYSQIYEDRE